MYYGKKGKWFFDLCILVSGFGSVMVYLALIGMTGSRIVAHWLALEASAVYPWFCGCFFGSVMMPLLFNREYGNLFWFAAGSLGSLSASLVVFYLSSFNVFREHDKFLGNHGNFHLWGVSAGGDMIFYLFCH